MIRRRELITVLGGAAATWPLAALAQQDARVRRIAVLVPFDENDPAAKTYVSAFTQALADLGWTDGRNVRMDLRWYGDGNNRMRAFAQELVGLQPDIILTGGTPATVALQRETQTIPIVFVNVSDPVASGIVPRLDRPRGNVTGFANYEGSLGGKWLELLLEIAPGLKRAAIVFNPDTAPVSTYVPSFETAARSLKVASITVPVHSDVEIETTITALGREPGGGLVVMPDAFLVAHRAPIIAAAARNNVPAVYADSILARDGGLLSYGPDRVDGFRRAATYVDRFLRGAKPGDLPVQRKAAHALGLQIQVVNASTIGEINAAFAALVRERADALLVNGDAFLGSRRVQLATLEARDRIPAAYSGGREFPVAGGLMSYGTNLTDAWRQVGVYTGNILKGDKPADLPVQQAVKFDFVINSGTATVPGIEVPPTLLALVTEVIE